jgi:ABC-type cobalamin transport system ATPase subunit
VHAPSADGAAPGSAAVVVAEGPETGSPWLELRVVDLAPGRSADQPTGARVELLAEINRTGVAMLMVEQNANMALSIAHRGYVLSTGRIVLQGAASELAANEELKRAYLGR